MKRLLFFFSAAILLYLGGCADVSNITSTESNKSPQPGAADNVASFTVTLKITQTSGLTNTVLVNTSYNTSTVGYTSQVNFSTLASRDGISTFKIEYGITWSNSPGTAWAGRYIISKNSGTYDQAIFTSPPSGGTINQTINNASFSESTTYHYQIGVDVITGCCEDFNK